jgi:hypothetical protein
MARSVLTADQKRRLLRQRIPDRMFEVYFCQQVITIMAAAKLPKSKTDPEVVLGIAGHQYMISPPKMLSFISLDAGIMMCRALMNFLGVYYGSESGRLYSRSEPRYDTSIHLGDFGFNPLSVAEACVALSGRDPDTVQNELLVTLETADTAVGHLTRTAARDIGILAKISHTCELVLFLMNKHLYDALGIDPVTFDGATASRYIRPKSTAYES